MKKHKYEQINHKYCDCNGDFKNSQQTKAQDQMASLVDSIKHLEKV